MPNDPPDAESVVELPLQIAVVPVIPDGTVDKELAVTVVFTHEVVLQVPDIRR